jgi:Zn-dependent M28 family amino/carboxypeptidase
MITATELLRHIKVLASDDFEGRAPGTPGEERTVAYLIEQFTALGLQPGNPDGSYVQRIPLVGITTRASVTFATPGERFDVALPTAGVAWSRRFVPEVRVEDSEVVFVGYGVAAPEYNWDDYKGADVRGKTLLMLINDPPVPDPAAPEKLDPRMFKGRAMTYYGRWTYKFEIAARKGAAAAVIIHETGPAGYPWSVVAESNTQEQVELQSPDKNAGAAAVESWITLEQARKMLGACGVDFAALKQAAVRQEFKPVPLGCKASFLVQNRLREFTSRNVLAKWEGGSARFKDEHVVFMAHWDHLGKNPALAGDQVYNGALDNASGVAALLEVAKAWVRTKSRPKRSTLFLSVSCEEQGLLGAKYYATHPLYPLESTVAVLNVDGFNPWGRTKGLEIIGWGNTTLEDLLVQAAATQGRQVGPEAMPERGYFYRSDHFEFAKLGVPSLYFKSGLDYVGRPKEFGLQKIEDFVAHHYHRVSDDVRPDWDLSGAVEDTQLLFQAGWVAAQNTRRPAWKPESELPSLRALGQQP